MTDEEWPKTGVEPEARCELCGELMPPGETMFKFHGYSGPCPTTRTISQYHEIEGETIRTTSVVPVDGSMDAKRFVWWFSDKPKDPAIALEWLKGVREHWTLDQWRAAIDLAMKKEQG